MWENPFSFTGFLVQICKECGFAAGGGGGVLEMGWRKEADVFVGDRLHYGWPGVLFGGYLFDFVENVGALSGIR